MSAGALRFSKEPGWDMTRAICPALSGDQGSASGALNQAQRRGVVRGIDYRLAEKVVGTGFNARRSVKIEWDAVDRRSEEHTSELQSLMRTSYAVFCLIKKNDTH